MIKMEEKEQPLHKQMVEAISTLGISKLVVSMAFMKASSAYANPFLKVQVLCVCLVICECVILCVGNQEAQLAGHSMLFVTSLIGVSCS